MRLRETFFIWIQQYSWWPGSNRRGAGAHEDNRGEPRVTLQMRFRALLVWALVSSFLLLCIGLPLSHDCADILAFGWQAASVHSAALSVTNPAQHRVPFQKRDVCQACLWSQALYLSRASAGPLLEHTMPPPPICAPAFLHPTSVFSPLPPSEVLLCHALESTPLESIIAGLTGNGQWGRTF